MRPFINHLMKQWWTLKEEFLSLACSKSKYLLSFKVYEGKSNDTNYEGLLLGEKTVLQICEPFLDKGYCIYFDNFLSTFSLLEKLLNRSTFECGTFRSSRKGYPKDLLLDDKNLKVGESG
jgi:hypothetical protein